MDLVRVAQQTIPPASNTVRLVHGMGNTQDIIQQILTADQRYRNQLAGFAHHLRGSDTLQTLRNVWQFVKDNIQYRIDPLGEQFVKAPAKTWADRYADCKSMSLFIGALLHNLRLPYAYRFVSYDSTRMYTHVYVVTNWQGNTIILDAVMPAFDQEKPFKHKKDYPMSKIYDVAGNTRRPGRLTISKPIDQLTEGEMDLFLARQTLEIQKEIAERKRGIGSLKSEAYQDAIDVINDAIDNIQDDVMIGIIAEDAERGAYSLRYQLDGIGDIGAKNTKRQQKKEERKQKQVQKKEEKKKSPAPGQQKPKTKVGKFLNNAVKKTAKAVTKVATAPARIAAKGILEVLLPKSAPFFLYLFINDASLLAKVPEKVRAKRKKAEKVANFIVNGIGMKREHFMQIVRNGITKRFGKSPESVITDSMRGKISGIGAVPIEAFQTILEIIQKIGALFKKKDDTGVTEQDAPDPESDFGTLTDTQMTSLTTGLKQQEQNVVPDSSDEGGEDPETTNTCKTGWC